MTTERYISRAIFAVLVAIAAIFAAGCEEPNEADLPRQIYVLKTNYTTQGTALDVDVDGNYAAVGMATHGAFVLDVADPLNIHQVFTYAIRGAASCRQVVLDATNNLFVVVAPDEVNHGPLPVFNFLLDSASNASYQATATLSGPFGQLTATPVQDTLWLWGTDRTPTDGFVAARLCFVPSRGKFDNCPPNFPNVVAPYQDMRGFGMRHDGVVALAFGQEGVYFHNTRNSEAFATINTPAVAYDCAWSGDSIVVVADNFSVVIIDAADLNAPRIIASLTIPNADRLQQVIVDGPYACVLDAFDGVYVVDVSNPRQPRFVQFLDGYDPTSLDAGPGGLYVTDEGYGLRIYARGPGF